MQTVVLRWKTLDKNVPYLPRSTSVGIIVGHKVYFYGLAPAHAEGKIFSLKNNLWTDIPLQHRPGTKHAAVLVGDKIYMFGGYAGIRCSNMLIVLDTVLGDAHLAKPSGEGCGKRAEMTAVWVPWQKEILFFGGIWNYGERATDEIKCNDSVALNVDTMSWRKVMPQGQLPQERGGHVAELVGKQMYVYGGVGVNNVYLSDICIADLSQVGWISWSKARVNGPGRAPIGRSVPTFNYLNGVFLMLGGKNNVSEVELDRDVYLLDKEEWRSSDDPCIEETGSSTEMGGVLDDNAVRHGERLIYFTVFGVFECTVQYK